MNTSYSEYISRRDKYEKLNNQQKKSINAIAYLRFSTFIVGLILMIYAWYNGGGCASINVFCVSLVVFIYLSVKHSKVIEAQKYSDAFLKINEDSLRRLNGEWKSFKDDGVDFKDGNHKYSQDLDIFGQNSLFQWFSCCRTNSGRQTLSKKLINPLTDTHKIKKVQEAVCELSLDLDFRQKFEAEARMGGESLTSLEELYSWASGRKDLYIKPWIAIVTRILPVVTVISFILSSILSPFRYTWTFLLLAIQMVIIFIDSKDRITILQSIFKNKNAIKVYYKMILEFQKKTVKSDYLIELKNVILGKAGEGAVEAMEKLFILSDIIADRKNMCYKVVNTLFLAEYANIIELEKWRRNFGTYLKAWIEVIGEIEALNSMAAIASDYPEWCTPNVIDEERVVKAQWIAHPLLGDKKVVNDIDIEDPKNILLITGSNMSGKSTFLRTIGVNLILAYIGAPVCAKSFTCSIMMIYTCMRTGDDLEKGISSFYAEILRVKSITKAAECNKNIFFLLDELFKGTNSRDRHAGATALINQLSKEGAVGMLSTHDLELCDMEKDNNKIKNYNFQEYYLNGKIKFDYKIREGKSTTRNAMYLIKLAGIHIC